MLSDLSGLSLVVVEDDQDNLDVLEMFLTHCGARVAAIRTAQAAIEYLGVNRADVIMTDVSVLPSGARHFITEVRSISHHKTTPVIAVTGWPEKDVRPTESGFAAFLQKPIDLDRLSTTILRLVRPAR